MIEALGKTNRLVDGLVNVLQNLGLFDKCVDNAWLLYFDFESDHPLSVGTDSHVDLAVVATVELTDNFEFITIFEQSQLIDFWLALLDHNIK